MAEVAPGAGASFQVNRGTLRQAAEEAGQISQDIGKLGSDVSSACVPAASAHSGWRFGQALAAAVPRWESHLRQQSSAVSTAGGKLAKSADNYATVEIGLVARAQAISSRLVG
jgi:predicted trehalose synthase